MQLTRLNQRLLNLAARASKDFGLLEPGDRVTLRWRSWTHFGLWPGLSTRQLTYTWTPDVYSARYWDDVDTADVQETDGDIVARALDTTAARMTEWLGADSAQWLWGRLHQVTLVADLFSLLTPEFNHGPFLNDGGLYTVDVANPRYDAANGRFDHPSGASMRYTCEVKADTGPDCTIQVPGGQQHYRDSPHYDDLLQKWLVNEAVPLTTDWATIEAGAEASLTAGPPE